MPKRDAVAPTSASVLALAFNDSRSDNTTSNNTISNTATYSAITSDGFIHQLK